MLSPIESFILTCDNCEAVFTNFNDFSIFADKEAAVSDAKEDEWHTEGGKHYCPNCHSIGDNDEVVINELKQTV